MLHDDIATAIARCRSIDQSIFIFFNGNHNAVVGNRYRSMFVLGAPIDAVMNGNGAAATSITVL